MDREELEALAAAAEEMRRYGQVSAETLKQLSEATNPTVKAFKKVETGLKGLSNGLGSVADGLTKTGGKLSNVSPAIDATTKSVKFLTAGMGLAGKAVGLFAEAVGGYAKFVVKQLDEIKANYRALGDIGATAEDGVDSLIDMFKAGGLATANLEHFIQQLKENTQGLATFGAGMVQGVERVTEVMGKLTDRETTARFERLGISVENVTAMSIKQVAAQARLGLTQSMTTNQVTESLQRYIEQVDLIARITGQNRQQQEEEQRAIMNDARFRAKLLDMEARGQNKEAEQLQAFVRGLPPQLAKAARDIAVFGYATSEEGRKTNLYTQDQLRQSVIAVQNGMTAENGIVRTMEGASRGVQTFGLQFKAAGDKLGTSVELLDMAAIIKTRDALAKEQGREIDLIKDAKLIQDRLLKGQNSNTRALSDATVNVLQAGKDVKTLQMALAMDAIPAVEGFTDAINKSTDLIRRVFGITGPRTKEEISQERARDAVRAKEKAERPILSQLTPAGSSVKFGQRPGGGALDIYDKKAMAAAAKMGLPDTSLMNPAVQNMANFYRKEDQERGGIEQLSAIRQMIGKYESAGGDYNIMQGGGRQALTSMTISDVLALQQSLIGQGKNSAAGKYQIINSTLMGLVKELGIDPTTTKFDQATQDRLADALIKRRGYDAYRSGKMSKEDFVKNLAQEWAALPAGADGKSFYEGQNGNKARVGWDQTLASFSRGGVFDQPQGMAMLHGPEAIVPLPDGRSIPVELNVGGTSMASLMTNLSTVVESLKNMSMLTNNPSEAQVRKLDTLIGVMQSQVDVSTKILRAQQ